MTSTGVPSPGARARRRQRAYFLTLLLISLGGATTLVLLALNDSLVFFHTPSELQGKFADNRYYRLGGAVELGSVSRQDGEISFIVADDRHAITVVYRGILPGLFREGDGVIAEGTFGKDGRFRAHSVLAKHDENYAPPTQP